MLDTCDLERLGNGGSSGPDTIGRRFGLARWRGEPSTKAALCTCSDSSASKRCRMARSGRGGRSCGSFRLTRLVVADTILAPLRSRFANWSHGFDKAVKKTRQPHRLWPWVYELVTCYWCIGFWISLAAAVVWRHWPDGTELALLPFAISAVVGSFGEHVS